MDIVVSMLRELRSSRQLQWTLVSVIVNMSLTLTIWNGVYEMKRNDSLNQTYFLGTSSGYSTGNEIYDGMINGISTIFVLGSISFIMLAFALFDFRRIVKTWLTLSCVMILFGVSGTTLYDLCIKYISDDQQLLIALIVIPITIIYGIIGVWAFFYESSLWLHQFYVIVNCSLVAVFYLRLFPGHTAWFVLWSIVFWDMFAVLAPMGPLKKVQEKAADYSNNVLRLLMFTADEKRKPAGIEKIEGEKEGEKKKEGIPKRVQELIELYSKQKEKDEEFVQNIRRRRQAINPDSDLTISPDMAVISNEKTTEKKDKNSDKEDESDTETEEESVDSSQIETVSSGTSEYSSTNEGGSIDGVETAEEIDEEDLLEVGKSIGVHLTAADALNDGDSLRLGFGDFVFYSLLIGQAATSGDWFQTFMSGVGVIIGLVATLTVFSSAEHTTPALPIPVICGTFAYFNCELIKYLASDYYMQLASI